MTNSQRVDVGESTGELVEVEFDVKEGKGDFGFLMVTRDRVNSFRDVF